MATTSAIPNSAPLSCSFSDNFSQGVPMKALLLLQLIFAFLDCTAAQSQSLNVTAATWIAGSSTANAQSVLGTSGVPSTTIYPGGRVMPCLAVTVQDSNYKIYIYGGQGYVSASLSYVKDFWRYNLATSEWTMLPENPSNTASLGTRGTESSSTFPGAFGRSACLINPRDNYLYMFGGVSGGRYNDMWRYNPTSGYWAWLGGGASTTATINTESSTIFPSTRRNAAMVAHPTLNILIMMSGFGADLGGSTTGDLNDMWKFNVDTNAWTWFGGSISALSVSSVFDTKGAATSANFPGGRNMHTTWIHPTSYMMYLFGGLTGTGTAYFNDMWSYDFTTGYWKWISGGTASNQVPIYGATGVFDPSYTPGARAAAIFSKVYNTTYLSLYGGRGYGINAATYNAFLNEMWVLDYSNNQWAWIVGSNEVNTYGTRGVTTSGSYPPGRNLYAGAPLAFQKSMVIYGGLTAASSYMPDMWKVDFNLVAVAVTSSSSVALSSSTDAASTAIAASTATDLGSVTVSSGSPAATNGATDSASTTVSNSVDPSAATSATLVATLSSLPPTFSTASLASGSILSTSSVATAMSSSKASSSVSSAATSISTSRGTTTTSAPTTRPASSTAGSAATTTRTSTSSIRTNSTTRTSSSLTVLPSSTNSVPDTSQAAASTDASIGTLVAQPEIIASIVAILIILGLVIFKLHRCLQRRKQAKSADIEFSTKSAVYTPEVNLQGTMPISLISQGSNAMSEPVTVSSTTATSASYSFPSNLKADAMYDYKCGELLGQDGSIRLFSGTALVPQLQTFGPAVLVKVVAETRSQLSQADADAFDHELSVLNLVSNRHAHVVSLLAWADQPMAILTKLFTQGTLDQWIANRVVATKSIKLGFWTDVSRGLAFLHENRVSHGDVRLYNIFIDVDSMGRPFCVLSNLGAAKVFSEQGALVSPSFAVDSIWTAYAAPEVILRFHHGLSDNQMSAALQADVFAIGVVAVELLVDGPAWPADA